MHELVGHGGESASVVASRNKMRAYTQARVSAFASWIKSPDKTNDENEVDNANVNDEVVQTELDRLLTMM